MPPVKRRMYATKQIAVAEMWVKLEADPLPLPAHASRTRASDPPKDARLRA